MNNLLRQAQFLILLLSLAFFTCHCNAQYYENIENGVIKVYFDYFGNPTDKNYAEFYRIGELNNSRNEFDGEIADYDLNNKLVFKGNYSNDMLNGSAQIYYNGGKRIKVNCYYTDNRRDSIWTFFYRNGNVKMKLLYTLEAPSILEYRKKRGKYMVKNGEGTLRFSPSRYMLNVKGQVKNGNRIGKWKNNQYTEYYDDEGNLEYGVNDFNKKTYFESQIPYTFPMPNEKAFVARRFPQGIGTSP